MQDVYKRQMQLDNQRIFSKKIKVPELLKDKLQLMTNCDLSVHEIDLFNVSLSCIEKQMQIDNINSVSYTHLEQIILHFPIQYRILHHCLMILTVKQQPPILEFKWLIKFQQVQVHYLMGWD